MRSRTGIFVAILFLCLPAARGGPAPKGLTLKQFNETVDRFEKIYAPIVAALGKRLVITRQWKSPYVSGYALPHALDGTFEIQLPGGFPRFPGMTQDAYVALMCHEMGHHLGGAPLNQGQNTLVGGLSVEGQADYYAGLKCLRRVFADRGTARFTRPPADAAAEAACGRVYPAPRDQAICARGAAAGLAMLRTLDAFHKRPGLLGFDAPDPGVASETINFPPEPQCRADTFLQGALCPVDVEEAFSADDPSAGACTVGKGYSVGMRPRCWYKPTAPEEAPPAGP